MPSKAQAPKQQDTMPEHAAEAQLPITLDVRIGSIRPNGSIRATASVNMNKQFAVNNIKIMDGKNGMFVSMPSYKAGNGEYKEHCFPITKEFREQLNTAVIEAYNQALNQSQQSAQNGVSEQDTPETSQDQGSQSMQL